MTNISRLRVVDCLKIFESHGVAREKNVGSTQVFSGKYWQVQDLVDTRKPTLQATTINLTAVFADRELIWLAVTYLQFLI